MASYAPFFKRLASYFAKHPLPTEELTVTELRNLIGSIGTLDPKVTSIEEFKTSVEKALETLALMFQIPPPGTLLFRVRKMSTRPTNISDLSSPPTHAIRQNGRLNRPGESVFYSSNSRTGACFEVKPALGDFLAISHWKVLAPLVLIWVGYSKQVFQQLSSRRADEVVDSYETLLRKYPSLSMRYDFLASLFSRDVKPGHEDEYKLSIAVAEVLGNADLQSQQLAKFRSAGLWLAEPTAAGFIYPTLAIGANADNIAIKSKFVQKYLVIEKAEWAKVIAAPKGLKMTLGIGDFAEEFRPDGTIMWKRNP